MKESQKNRYKPTTIVKEHNDSFVVSLVKDERCTNPYLIYAVYTQVSPEGKTLQSRPLLWWWGFSEEQGREQLKKFLKEKKKK